MSVFWRRFVLNFAIVIFAALALGGCNKTTEPSATCTDNTATNKGSPGECHYATPTPGPPATTVFTLSGLVTDGTSGGILPNIDVQILDGGNSGKAGKTDGTGHYSIGNVNAGGMNVKFSATSYVDQVVGVNVSANTTLNVILQRTAPVAPPPPASISLTGVVTDGTSGGVLPGVSVRIVASGTSNFGKNVLSDSSGRYTISGLVAESRVNVEATVSGYQVGANSASVPGTLNFVLQRAATTAVLQLILDLGTCGTSGQSFADVSIDGRFSGLTLFNVAGHNSVVPVLSVGSHSVLVQGGAAVGTIFNGPIIVAQGGTTFTILCGRRLP